MGKELARPRDLKMPKAPGTLTKNRVVKSSKSSSEEKKDQISIRDLNSRLIHKFACNTCIQGHRAPLCDPIKHRNKILFRRPTPGRPARSCGHTHLPHCECRASRKLCCSLTNEQWDQLIAGEIPTAVMYDSQQALEEASAAAETARMLTMYTYGQSLLPYRPAPQAGMHAMWPGSVVPYGQLLANQPGYPVYPPALPSAYPPSAHQPAYPMAISWAGPNDTHGYGGLMDRGQMYGMQIDGDQMHGAQNTHAYTDFAADMAAPPFPSAFATYDTQAPALPDEFNMSMITEEQIAAQPSSNPTQSCCSSKPQPPQLQQPMMQTMQPYALPTADPRHQFPCQQCASFSCGCLNCPEVRQTSNGAWSQACGRGNHVDNAIPSKLEFTVYENHRDTPTEHTARPPALHQPVPDMFATPLYNDLMSVPVQEPMPPQFQGNTPAHLQGVDRFEELPDSSPCATNDSTVDFMAPNGTMDPRMFVWDQQQ